MSIFDSILALLLGPIRFIFWIYRKWTDKPYPKDLHDKTRDEFLRKIREHNKEK